MKWTYSSQRKEYGKALVELGRARNDIVVLDADLSGSTRTADFGKEFPERFFNVGIAEQNMIGTAAGLALPARPCSLRPSQFSPPDAASIRSGNRSPIPK